MIKQNKAFKVVYLGSSGVGKTSINGRFCNDSFFPGTTSTIGAAFSKMKLATDVYVDIWDTAGQERFQSLMPMYYRDAFIGIVVFDILCIKSFERARKWINEIMMQKCCSHILLLGNKIDLIGKNVNNNNGNNNNNNNQIVKPSQIDDFLTEENLFEIKYLEVSAYDSTGIDKMKEIIIQWCSENLKKEQRDRKDRHIINDSDGIIILNDLPDKNIATCSSC
jgi:small GTP-binding protein